MSISQNTQTEQYAVIAFTDLFGTGYRVQKSEFVADAIADGWEVIINNRTNDEAEHIARIYRNAGKPESNETPDLSDVLSYDFTQEVEDRDSSVAEEFDLVQILWQGRVIEGVITYHDEDIVELDGFIEVSPAYFLKHATLIAKADSDSGFMKTYGAWLTKLDNNQKELFEYAAKAQNTMEYGEVA